MIDRRRFVAGALALLAWPRLGRADSHAAAESKPAAPKPPVPEWMEKSLELSRYAYVSPLKSDGSESECHGEVWYAWLDGEVVTTTGTDRWKARAIERGLDRARVWFGNYGRWKSPGGKNEAFRRGPRVIVQGSFDRDPALLERILSTYEKKYPEEIGRWRDRMRKELAEGKRVIVRYRPVENDMPDIPAG